MTDAAPAPQHKTNALFNTNKLKLGPFSLNADGGITITKVPERWRADWSDIVDVAKMVDRAGFEFILPIARWKGYGGTMDVRTLCFGTFTFAAAPGARRNRQVDTAQIFNERKRYAAGLGSHPLIGSPQTIAEELVRLHAAGIDGVALSFVNFKDELPFFVSRVLPLLRQAGLRRA